MVLDITLPGKIINTHMDISEMRACRTHMETGHNYSQKMSY